MTGLGQDRKLDRDAGVEGGFVFSLEQDDWRAHDGGAEIAPLVAFPPDPALAGTARRGPGLPAGEAALAAAAAARLLGCFHSTASNARDAVDGLRQARQVRVLLEEGLPSPLTGRLGAVIAAAAALTRSPPVLAQRDIWRLEETTLDDHEMLDLVHAAAMTAWTARLRLALGARPLTRSGTTESRR